MPLLIERNSFVVSTLSGINEYVGPVMRDTHLWLKPKLPGTPMSIGPDGWLHKLPSVVEATNMSNLSEWAEMRSSAA